MIDIKLSDGAGGGHLARVTHAGELVVVRGNYDTTTAKTLSLTNTAYNVALPLTNKKFIITGLIVNTGNDVSPTAGATVVLYEASSDTTTTVDKNLITLVVPDNSTVPITGLLIESTVGKYINIKTDDATVNITLLGYYLEIDSGHN